MFIFTFDAIKFVGNGIESFDTELLACEWERVSVGWKAHQRNGLVVSEESSKLVDTNKWLHVFKPKNYVLNSNEFETNNIHGKPANAV